jgi:hypothetical protein
LIDKKKFPNLNLPVYNAKVRIIDEVIHIHDDFRSKFVVLTPEEWVRQHFAHYLTGVLGYPKGRVMLEYQIDYHGRPKRPDIGIIDQKGALLILVECKAPNVPLNEDVFLQLASYHSVTESRFLVLTNGLHHVVAQVQPSDKKIVYIEALPKHS